MRCETETGWLGAAEGPMSLRTPDSNNSARTHSRAMSPNTRTFLSTQDAGRTTICRVRTAFREPVVRKRPRVLNVYRDVL
jgi:hypothetical protein